MLTHLSVSSAIWIAVAAYFGNAFYTLYKLWNPPPCVPGKGVTCVAPLFQADDRVDMYVFASTTKRSATAMSRERFNSKLIPLWNVTNVSFADTAADVNVTVPVPPSVRRNGTLFAHVMLVRSGKSPFPGDHRAQQHDPDDVSAMWYHYFPDLVYARGTITRHLVPIARNRTMLLGAGKNASSSLGGNGSAVGGGGDAASENKTAGAAPAHEHRETAAQWIANVAAGFGLSAMAPANPLTAVARFGLVGVGVYFVPEFVATVRDALTSDEVSLDDVIQLSSGPPVTHWKSRLDVNLVQDFELYSMARNGATPSIFVEFSEHHGTLLNRFYKLFASGDRSRVAAPRYAPWLEVDEFSLVTKYLRPLSTDPSRPDPALVIRVTPMSRTRFQVTKQMEGSTTLLRQFGFSEYDLDDVKQLVSETSLRMLALTYVISMLHMVFDYLAFKNDVGFFSKRKDYTGISGRTLLSSFVSSVIITLYLMDNEYTSRIVLGSVVVGTVIDGWKVNRVMRPTVYWRYGLPWVQPADMAHRSKGENSTDDIDAVGFRWLSYALYPLVLAWAVYSLLTDPHKSWWSWAIHSLANGVYTFGFIMMTPQLFINYKLKSVAHLPWKVFMYKAFNTFIDDVFSFIMVMPTAHRIACLRDDVVFFVYLYQRWLYPVDMKRANEFGMAYEEDEEDAKDANCASEDAQHAAAAKIQAAFRGKRARDSLRVSREAAETCGGKGEAVVGPRGGDGQGLVQRKKNPSAS